MLDQRLPELFILRATFSRSRDEGKREKARQRVSAVSSSRSREELRFSEKKRKEENRLSLSIRECGDGKLSNCTLCGVSHREV